VPAAVDQILSRAKSELLLAEAAIDPGERFRRAHLAALRAAAAVLERRALRPVRGRPRSVWELLQRDAPELQRWAAFFASGARLRAAVESGRDPGVTPEQADHLVTMARRFLDVVEERPAAHAS
jgi:predicted ArsR family transcriptional regulator